MTTFTTNRPASRSILARLIAGIVAWNDARATRISLGRLSNHELDDIGLVRSDIERIARNG
jgi:uncharacterized protein YjiS (DUF1127 family)